MTFRRRVGRPALPKVNVQILPPLVLVMALDTVTFPVDARAEPNQRVQPASVALDSVTLPPAAAASPAPSVLPFTRLLIPARSRFVGAGLVRVALRLRPGVLIAPP